MANGRTGKTTMQGQDRFHEHFCPPAPRAPWPLPFVRRYKQVTPAATYACNPPTRCTICTPHRVIGAQKT